MILKCPSCGARCSAESWENEVYTMKALTVAAKMPAVCGEHALQYIAMFRDPNASRSMSWQKAYNRLKELSGLVTSGIVDVQGKTPVKCSTDIWGQALEKIKQRNLKLPLNNHRYLKKIAFELAEQAGKVKGQRLKIVKKATDEQPQEQDSKEVFQNILTPFQQEHFDKIMEDETTEFTDLFNQLNSFEQSMKAKFGKNSKVFRFAMQRVFLKQQQEALNK